MNNLLNRLKKVEQSAKKKKSVIRFIEEIGDEFVITQSTYKAEINTRLRDLNDLEKLDKVQSENTINFIEILDD
jgi:hypothetical protein